MRLGLYFTPFQRVGRPRILRSILGALRLNMASLPLAMDSRAWNLDIILSALCLRPPLSQCLFRVGSTGILIGLLGDDS